MFVNSIGNESDIKDESFFIQYLLYIFYYFCSTQLLTECTFNIFLGDDFIYEENKQNVPIINFKNKNIQSVINKVYNFDVNYTINESKKTFMNKIEQVSEKLKKIEDKTCNFKFNNSFELYFSEKYGLFNSLQHSGSCTFYSYYNLGINMLIFYSFIQNNFEIEDVVINILKVHFKNLYMFKKFNNYIFSRDLIRVVQPKVYNTIIYNYNYFYSILEKNNCLEQFGYDVNIMNCDMLLKNCLNKQNYQINQKKYDLKVIINIRNILNDFLFNIRKNKGISVYEIEKYADKYINVISSNDDTSTYTLLFTYFYNILLLNMYYTYNSNSKIYDNEKKYMIVFSDNDSPTLKMNTILKNNTNIHTNYLVNLLYDNELLYITMFSHVEQYNKLISLYDNENVNLHKIISEVHSKAYILEINNTLNLNDAFANIYYEYLKFICQMNYNFDYKDRKDNKDYYNDKFIIETKKIIKRNINNIGYYNIFKIIFILTKGNLILHNYSINNKDIFFYLNDEKHLFLSENDSDIIMNYYNNNKLAFINFLIINPYEDIMKYLLDISHNYHNKIDKLLQYNNFEKNITNNEYVKSGIKYRLYNKNTTNLSTKIFLRIGLDYNVNYNYYVLESNINIFYIFIKDYNKIFRLTHISTDNFKIEMKNLDDVNENNYVELIFGYDKLKRNINMFLCMFPSSSPYLCYEKNNKYFIEFLYYSHHFYNNNKIIFKKNVNNYSFETKLMQFEISPSKLFILIDSFNYEDYNILYDFYMNKQLNFNNDNIVMDKNYSLNDNGDMIKINNYVQKLSHIINEYKAILNKNKHNNIHFEYVDLINDINDCIVNRQNDENDENYIVKNFHISILTMITNIFFNIYNQYNTNLDKYDKEHLLNVIDDLNNFFMRNDTTKHYFFELFFMLQNKYIFKQLQIDKYREILNDFINTNPSLKIHQFMMGKGKTSVVTPLLSFAINFITDLKNSQKIATIITKDNLIKQTNKYLNLTKQLFKYNNVSIIKINVFSDYEAKKRWIEYTDINLRRHNNNNESVFLDREINIIDEFDSHYNYLQSQFNYVDDNTQLDNNIINYIFSYIYRLYLKKNNTSLEHINNDKILININEIIKQKLKIELNNCYIEASKLKNNKDYGFGFLYDKTLLNEQKRLIIPFARKDTPIFNSKFSSLLLTLILTINIYIKKYKAELQYFDYYNLIINKNIIILLKKMNKIISDKYNDICLIINDDFTNNENKISKLKTYFTNNIYFYENNQINIYDKYDLLFDYLKCTNINELVYTSTQYNLSFQDIIHNVHNQLQVGYTGTTHFKLLETNNTEDFIFKEKHSDNDEIIEINNAFNRVGHDTQQNNVDQPINYIVKSNDNFKNLKNIFYNCYNHTHNTEGHAAAAPIKTDIITSSKIGKYHNKLNKAKETNVECNQNNLCGIIDLVGLFVNENNRNIAKMLKQFFPHKNIIYIDDNLNALQFNENNNEDNNMLNIDSPYIEENNYNFYYYDNRNVVGIDLKQARHGEFIILIGNNTRITDFSQAIFRFRKLNRGTFMNVCFVNESENQPNDLTYNTLKKRLYNNEDIFNDSQEIGIKYQLFKTYLRKIHKSYIETSLKPNFLLTEEINVNFLLNRLKENVHFKDEYNTHTHIKSLYDFFNVANIDILKHLIMGHNIEQVEEKEKEKEKEKEEEKEKEKEEEKEETNFGHNEVNFNFTYDNYVMIEHLNCFECLTKKCILLFKDEKYKINEKNIYVSYNVLIYLDIKKRNDNRVKLRLCFVEFNNFIMIEELNLALLLYNNKLPLYFDDGTLIYKNIMSIYGDKLIFNDELLYLFNFNNNQCIDNDKLMYQNDSIYDSFSDLGLIAYYYIIKDYNLYNLNVNILHNKMRGIINKMRVVVNKIDNQQKKTYTHNSTHFIEKNGLKIYNKYDKLRIHDNDYNKKFVKKFLINCNLETKEHNINDSFIYNYIDYNDKIMINNTGYIKDNVKINLFDDRIIFNLAKLKNQQNKYWLKIMNNEQTSRKLHDLTDFQKMTIEQQTNRNKIFNEQKNILNTLNATKEKIDMLTAQQTNRKKIEFEQTRHRKLHLPPSLPIYTTQTNTNQTMDINILDHICNDIIEEEQKYIDKFVRENISKIEEYIKIKNGTINKSNDENNKIVYSLEQSINKYIYSFENSIKYSLKQKLKNNKINTHINASEKYIFDKLSKFIRLKFDEILAVNR